MSDRGVWQHPRPKAAARLGANLQLTGYLELSVRQASPKPEIGVTRRILWRCHLRSEPVLS